MDGDTIANLVYLGILVTVIGGFFFASNRPGLGQTVQTFLIWGLIFVGFIAAYGMWNSISDNFHRQTVVATDAHIDIPRSRNGHFVATLLANGVPVEFIVDTGATQVVLSQEDAERIGLDPENLGYFGIANTANGQVKTAQVRLDSLQFENVTKTNFEVSVNGGELDVSLLGMEYLNTFSKIEIDDRILRLIP